MAVLSFMTGVPLLATNIFHKDRKSLIDKRVMDWKNKSLSIAGRLQLLKSVVSSIQVYWSSIFLIVIKEIESIMRNLLWSCDEGQKGKAKVSWKELCFDKKQGGLGLRSLRDWNVALHCGLNGVHTYRLKERNFWDVHEVL